MTEVAVKNSAQELFNTWDVYEHVLEHNCMFHREIYADVQALLAQRFAGTPMAVLDLGCGSARHMAQVLRTCNVARYAGCDLSAAAIDEARSNLTPLACPLDFYQGDMLARLQTNTQQYDLIFSSYAMHHLPHAEKVQAFQLAYAALSARGVMIVIDPVREDGEARMAFLDRNCAWIKSDWQFVPLSAREAVCDHAMQDDYPESPAELQKMSADAGFSRCNQVNRHLFYQTWCFEK